MPTLTEVLSACPPGTLGVNGRPQLQRPQHPRLLLLQLLLPKPLQQQRNRHSRPQSSFARKILARMMTQGYREWKPVFLLDVLPRKTLQS